MTANLFPNNGLADIQMHERDVESSQATDTTTVAPNELRGNPRKSEDEDGKSAANSSRQSGMPASDECVIRSSLCNVPVINDLRGLDAGRSDPKTQKNARSLIAPSTLVRWCKFNLVGGIGIVVQFAALFFLRSVMRFNYLAATTLAVEAAVVHNFVWHEQFTWSDRTLKGRATGSQYGPSLRRLLRFNLTTGAVSILGNLALMKVMVGLGHVNYLLANAIAIVLCSLANFLVSEAWVFARE
jgi:putative flippase GtrA